MTRKRSSRRRVTFLGTILLVAIACFTGPGQSIDRVFTVWQCEVPVPGVVTLGACAAKSMYGIAAVPMTGITETGNGSMPVGATPSVR